MPNWIKIAAADECPPGEAREFVAAGKIIALFHVDGAYHAIDGICPHQGGPLGQGELNGCVVTCPWHGFQFDVRDGRPLTSAQLSHPAFPVKLEGGHVYVDLPE